MNRFWLFLLDLLFPLKCAYCQKILDDSTAPCCPNCLDDLPWIDPKERLRTGTAFSTCLSVVWYEAVVRDAFLRFKFRGQPEWAKAFAVPLIQALGEFDRYDLITWVPVSAQRLRSRGYDQARLLAVEVAKGLGQVATPLLSHVHQNAAQSSLGSYEERVNNIKGSFALRPEVSVEHQRILLIDDMITTGATLEEVSAILQKAGAREVACASFCRPRKGLPLQEQLPLE